VSRLAHIEALIASPITSPEEKRKLLEEREQEVKRLLSRWWR
jgi:hypothetical protein